LIHFVLCIFATDISSLVCVRRWREMGTESEGLLQTRKTRFDVDERKNDKNQQGGHRFEN